MASRRQPSAAAEAVKLKSILMGVLPRPTGSVDLLILNTQFGDSAYHRTNQDSSSACGIPLDRHPTSDQLVPKQRVTARPPVRTEIKITCAQILRPSRRTSSMRIREQDGRGLHRNHWRHAARDAHDRSRSDLTTLTCRILAARSDNLAPIRAFQRRYATAQGQ